MVGVSAIEFCDNCGGSKSLYAPARGYWCRCKKILAKTMRDVERIDPNGTMTFDSYEAATKEQQEALRLVEDVISLRSKGVILCGQPGVGKTHLAISALRRLCEEEVICSFESVIEFVSKIQETYSNDWWQESRNALIGDLGSRELVVFDDFGQEKVTDDVQGILHEAFDVIYRKDVRLIITTNLLPGEIRGRYSAAVASRIKGRAPKAALVKGEDRRENGW